MDKLVYFREKNKEQFFIDSIGMFFFGLGGFFGFFMSPTMLYRLVGVFVGAQVGLTIGFMIGYGIVGKNPAYYDDLDTCLTKILINGFILIFIYTFLFLSCLGNHPSFLQLFTSGILGIIIFYIIYKSSFILARR